MPFSIEVAKDEDLHELMQVLWTCFENPPQGILRVFFPILNDDREASLLAASDGQRDEYKEAYPELIWLKVVDNETGKIIAGAKWYFYESNPFASHDPLSEEAVWYPEGVGRQVATSVMHAFEKPRVTMGQRPHSCKSWYSTLYNFILQFCDLLSRCLFSVDVRADDVNRLYVQFSTLYLPFLNTSAKE